MLADNIHLLWLRRLCSWEVGGSVPICSSLCAKLSLCKIVKPELLSDVFIEVLMLDRKHLRHRKKCLDEWVNEARKVLELKSTK